MIADGATKNEIVAHTPKMFATSPYFSPQNSGAAAHALPETVQSMGLEILFDAQLVRVVGD